MQNPSSILPLQDITNTKFVAVALVLGLKLQKPGIYITIDKDHPGSTGGQAHFLFESNLKNSVHNYLQIYEAGTADAELDTYLETLPLTQAQRDELSVKISEGILVYGRKFLDQYQYVARYVRDEVKRFVITGGEPVRDKNGAFAGIQDFTITQQESK